MIQIKSGVYGSKKGMKRASDGPFSLSPEEEARLVKRGVAKYVGAPVEEPAEDNPALDAEKPLSQMTPAELRALGKEYGLTFRVGMTKAAMADAINAKMEQLDYEDEEDPEEDFFEDEDGEDSVDDPPAFDPSKAVQ